MSLLLTLSLMISLVTRCKTTISEPEFSFYGTGTFGKIEPTNTRSFIDLLRSDFYVDKTLILKEISKTYQGEVLYLVLPAKFGKSVNLDMIRTFFGLYVDKDGNANTSIRDTPAYKLFYDGAVPLADGQIKVLPKVLLISHYKRILDKHLGKYPIINVNLGHINGSNLSQIIELVNERVKASFDEHPYLKTTLENRLSSNITDDEKTETTRQLESYLRIVNKKATREDIVHSLQLLTDLVRLHFGIRPYLLIDDFEGIMFNVLINWSIGEKETSKVLEFANHFFKYTMDRNYQMEKGFISGSMAMLSVFKNISNFIDYKPTAHPIMELYTLLHDDLLTIFKHYNVPEDIQQQALNWYGGHRWSRGYRKKIYNIFAIRQFLCTGELDYIRERHQTYDKFFEELLQKYVRMRLFAIDRIYGEVWGHIPRIAKPINYDLLIDTKNHLLNSSTARRFTYPKLGFAIERLILPEALEPYGVGAGIIALRFVLGQYFVFMRTPHNEAKMWIGDKLIQFYCREWGLAPELLDKAVHNMAQFIKDGETKVDDLAEFLKHVTENDRIMDDMDLYEQEDYGYRAGFGKFMNSLFNYLGLRVALEYNSLNIEPVDSYDGPVTSFTWHNLAIYNDKRVVFFEVHVNETAPFALTKARSEYDRIVAFINHTHKYVGICVRADGAVEILQDNCTGPFTTTTPRPSNNTRTTLSIGRQRKKDRMGIKFYDDIDYDPDKETPIIRRGKGKKKKKTTDPFAIF